MAEFLRTDEFEKPDETCTLIDELIASVATGNAQRRLRVVQQITDLFVAGSRRYSREQIGLFDDVLQQLAAEIEVKARAKLANRLARIDNAPPRLIRTLAFDDQIVVAEPVLVHSSVLTEADLIENANTMSQKHLLAIAQRLKLTEGVTDALVARGNKQVLHKVAGNKGARFSLAGYGKLVKRARYDRKLTVTLGERSDIPRQYFLKLLENASASVRAKLEASSPLAKEAIRNAVDEIATKMQRETREKSRPFAAAARDTRRRFNAHPVTEVNVHAPAHAQEFEKTVLALAKLGRFPVDLVERALLDEGEDMVLLLAKAAGCAWVTARELLLMYAAKRALSADDLSRAFDRYERLSEDTARRVIQFHQRRTKRRSATTVQAANANEKAAESERLGQAARRSTELPSLARSRSLAVN